MRRWVGLLGGLWLALAAAGCGVSPSSLCNDECDCEGCSDRRYDECVRDREDAERDADREGCVRELDLMFDCWDDEQECRGGAWEVEQRCRLEEGDYERCMGRR